jgi:hypothetical protein
MQREVSAAGMLFNFKVFNAHLMVISSLHIYYFKVELFPQNTIFMDS